MPVAPEFLAELRRRTSLTELIGGGPAAVALKPGGRGEMKGLCPFHKERTPSFYVIEAKGFWHCFGCGAGGDAIKWVRRTTNARDFAEAVEYLAQRVGLSQTGPSLEARPIVQRPAQDLLAAERARKTAGARDIWRATQTATEWTPAGRYLRDARRIRLAIPPTIRFHDRLEHPFLRRGVGFPAMVSAIADRDRHVAGVHCTFLGRGEAGWTKMAPPPGWPPAWLASDEQWKAKIMRGDCRGNAIRLTPPEQVMVVAEGIETALSVLQALYDEEIGAAHIDGEPVGVWAAGSLGNLGAIWLPEAVREVILAVDGDGKIPDADDPGRVDPEAIIDAAAARHRDLGRNVRIARPPAGADFNDMVPPGAGAPLREDEEIAA